MGFVMDQWLSPRNFGGDSSSFSAGRVRCPRLFESGNFRLGSLCLGRKDGAVSVPISSGLSCKTV
jgi:hypothetical protein